MEVLDVSEQKEQKPVDDVSFLYTEGEGGFYIKKNLSFLAAFWFANKMFFYTSFSKKFPVSKKQLNIASDKDEDKGKKSALLIVRIVLGCFALGVILLGCGIPFLCLDILFKLAIAMTVIGAICSTIYSVMAIWMAYLMIGEAGKGNLKLTPENIPKGYKLGDSIIPMKPKEKETEDKNKKEYEIKK